MGASLVSITASVGVTIVRLIELRREHEARPREEVHLHTLDETRADITFAFLLLWTAGWAYYHVVIAILSERPYDLVTYMISTLIVWGYVLINFFRSQNPPEAKLIRLILTSAFVPPIVGIGSVLTIRYSKSKRHVFNTVGANEAMQEMFVRLLLHDSLLKFDFQMAIRCAFACASTATVS